MCFFFSSNVSPEQSAVDDKVGSLALVTGTAHCVPARKALVFLRFDLRKCDKLWRRTMCCHSYCHLLLTIYFIFFLIGLVGLVWVFIIG